MLPLYGTWEVEPDGKEARYHDKGGGKSSHGLVLLGRSINGGIIGCSVTLSEPNEGCGAFVVFRAEGDSKAITLRALAGTTLTCYSKGIILLQRA